MQVHCCCCSNRFLSCDRRRCSLLSLLSLVDNGELEDEDGDDGEGVEEEVFIIFEKDI